MPRKKATTLATSPIVAMAERAAEMGAKLAVLVYVDRDGDRRAISLQHMDEYTTVGLLSLAVADFSSGDVYGAGEEDEE